MGRDQELEHQELSRFRLHQGNSRTENPDSPVSGRLTLHILVSADCLLAPTPTPHLSCFDRDLQILSIESRSLVEMNDRMYSFFDFERISASLRRPAALVIFAILDHAYALVRY